MDRGILVSHIDCWGLPREKVLQFAFLNSYFKTYQNYPLDDAILAYVYTNGYKFQPSKWKKIDEIPFDFIRRKGSVILETETKKGNRSSQFNIRLMITKGALEEVLRVCSYVEDIDSGSIAPLSSEEYLRILNLGEEVSNEGLRCLGIAIKRIQTVSLISVIFILHTLDLT